MLNRAERRRKDAGITLDRGWYMKDNEWTQSVGAEVEGVESEYCQPWSSVDSTELHDLLL